MLLEVVVEMSGGEEIDELIVTIVNVASKRASDDPSLHKLHSRHRESCYHFLIMMKVPLPSRAICDAAFSF